MLEYNKLWVLRMQVLHLDPGATRALACRADAYEEINDLQRAIQVLVALAWHS